MVLLFTLILFVMPAVLGLDVVTSESLFGYESTSKDVLAVVAGPDVSGEQIVLPDTSQFLQPSVQVSGNYNACRKHILLRILLSSGLLHL